MIEEKFAPSTDAQVPARDAVTFVAAPSAANLTQTMTVQERIMVITTDATYTTTVVLPSVAEAKGGIYTIRLVTDGGQNVTVTDKNDDAALTDITLADAGDAVCLYSDGFKWFVLGTIGLTATDYD